MNESEQEKEMAARIYQAIQDASNKSERSLQAKEWRIGISDLGYCSERTRRMLNQENPEDTDVLTAFIGTAIGDHLEQAIAKHAYPTAIIQPEVELVLEGGSRTYRIPGHPDVVIPEGILLDGKTSLGLSLTGQYGAADRQKRYQRHACAKAAAAAGMFDVSLEEVMVGNVWIDRSGQDKYALVHLEPYDPEVIDEATEWLEEVIYNYTQGQEAAKEPPREVCAKTCGFFRVCRAYDTDVSGLLTDEQIVAAIVQYEEGRDLVNIGERLKKQAHPVLQGVTGFALIGDERFSLRWNHQNETTIRESKRKAHDKIELKRLK